MYKPAVFPNCFQLFSFCPLPSKRFSCPKWGPRKKAGRLGPSGSSNKRVGGGKKKRKVSVRENICICYGGEFQHAQSSCRCERRRSRGLRLGPAKPFLHRRGTSKKRRLSRDRSTESARTCLRGIQIRQNSLESDVMASSWEIPIQNQRKPFICLHRCTGTFYWPTYWRTLWLDWSVTCMCGKISAGRTSQ